MTLKSFSTTSAVLVAFSLSLAQARVKPVGRITVAEEARQTINELQRSAAQVGDDADERRTFIGNQQLSLQSHSEKLTAMKDEINTMGRQLATVYAEREALPAWEQEAVVKVLPLLKETAANTESAIKYESENSLRLWTPEYRGHADRIWKDSEEIATTLKNYLDLAKLHDREQRLNASLASMTTTD